MCVIERERPPTGRRGQPVQKLMNLRLDAIGSSANTCTSSRATLLLLLYLHANLGLYIIYICIDIGIAMYIYTNIYVCIAIAIALYIYQPLFTFSIQHEVEIQSTNQLTHPCSNLKTCNSCSGVQSSVPCSLPNSSCSSSPQNNRRDPIGNTRLNVP